MLPTQISIFIQEPSTCKYILTVSEHDDSKPPVHLFYYPTG